MRIRSGCVISAVLSLLFPACQPNLSTVDPLPARPYAAITLRVLYSPAITHTERLENFAREWSLRTGAQVEVAPMQSYTDEADIFVTAPGEIASLIVTDRVIALPNYVRERDYKYQWNSVVDSYASKLTRWNSNLYALPLLAEGRVLVYREDRFKKGPLGTINPPATWEQFVSIAATFHQPGKPSLPPLPKQAIDLETEFYLIAANYDRLARSPTEEDVLVLDEFNADRLFSFQYQLLSLKPRIGSAAFQHAFRLMQEMQKYRPSEPSDNPAEAFRKGDAVLAIVPLSELYRLQQADSPVRGKFGIAGIPGSELVYDADEKPLRTRGGTINRIPYIGWGGWFGMVSKSSAHADAAIDFLAEFAQPDRNGAEVIAAARWGAGPFRLMHTDPRFRHLWFGYDLSSDETDRLLAALRDNLAPAVVNYRVCLRLPNQKPHREILAEELRNGLAKPDAQPKEVLGRAANRWEEIWKKDNIPQNVRQDWIRLSLGLQN